MKMTSQSLQHTMTYRQQKHTYGHTYTASMLRPSKTTSYAIQTKCLVQSKSPQPNGANTRRLSRYKVVSKPTLEYAPLEYAATTNIRKNTALLIATGCTQYNEFDHDKLVLLLC